MTGLAVRDVAIVRYSADGWGVGELWLDGQRIVHHELPRPPLAARAAPHPNDPQGIPRIPGDSVAGTSARLRAERVASLLREFFAGREVSLDDVELDLDAYTPFQRALVDVLRSVPRGAVVTYGELAALAGSPGAQRAAGTFCAQNRFPIFVPCHRVVAADGIGSYGSLGVEYKRRLLALEHVHF